MSQSDVEKDYDELQSDLEEEDCGDGFHVGERLDPPQARLYTTQGLHTLIHEGVIDLNPPYQRGLVWTEPKQMKLLDSIYRNFYVPPVVFAVYKDEDGEEVMKCVDGKQRLTSIQKFFDGQIPYRDPKTKKTYWYTRPESYKTTRLEVPPTWKQDFASKQITCVQYRNLSKSFERDIFQRVQLGMPLTAAEKLQAIASPWAEWISDLEARFISSDDGLTSVIDVDTKRGRDFQCLSQLVYCCDGYPEHLLPTSQKMESFVSRMDVPNAVFKTAIKDVLTEFWHIANTPQLNAAFTNIPKRVAPAEFVFIGLLLYVMRDCSHEMRATEIFDMRTYVRKKFADVRMRNDILKYLWAFVDDLTNRMDGGRGTIQRSTRSSGDASGRKRRKRKNDSDSEVDEYRPVSNGASTKRSKGRGR
ncbi:hypothetical protein SCP_0313010 [Sparassis crispa]|uniref:GmrSD restriction endonucleases N-terminal domain-containing protein n=1 Tax=Sparassis crispa TaxID=139825 RepID=A0A401GHD5_9APHY|nr:hypothetical protein SCP_0313010 [Sparassis crispa]GBE81572.1 hypothetical protein SCP_0313010 [Sparassis crispa]